MKLLVLLLTSLNLVACSSKDNLFEVNDPTKRWYSSNDVKTGQHLFKQHCAVCHGEEAQGVVTDWKQPLVDGHYPAPPLNGTAHAWHHSLNGLNRTILHGGIPLGGTMPAFKNKLTPEERLQAIAYFQSFWSNKIYQAWLERGGLKNDR